MKPMDRDYLLAAFDRTKKGRAWRKLGHPVPVGDASDERSGQDDSKPPPDTNLDDPRQKPENRDHA